MLNGKAGRDPCPPQIGQLPAKTREILELCACGLETPFQRFDAIHLGDVLEHLPHPASLLRELEPLGGVFFIEGPLENNPSLVKDS